MSDVTMETRKTSPLLIAVENSIRLVPGLEHVTMLPYGVFTAEDFQQARLRRLWANQMYGNNIDQRISQRLRERNAERARAARTIKADVNAYENGLEQNTIDRLRRSGGQDAEEYQQAMADRVVAGPTFNQLLEEQRKAIPKRKSKRKKDRK